MTDLLIEITGLTKDYRGLRPLRIERLSVAAGEHVAIVGVDQAAAEVLVNLVTGATLPDAGEVKAFGRSTASIADGAEWLALVDRFGIVSERAVLIEGLSAIQNLSMPFTLEIDPPPGDIRDRAVALAREVGLPEPAWAQRVGELDAVSRVRLRLARALALDPAIVLLEHPTALVPREHVIAMGRAIRAIVARRGASLIAATADTDFAGAAATRVLTLHPATGRLAERRARFRWLSRSTSSE